MRRFIPLVLLTCIGAAATAQPRLAVRTISVADGLSQSTGQMLLQDSRGLIWIGTQDGLNRYDGLEFKVYRPSPLGRGTLSGPSVVALLEDPDGSIWVGTEFSGLNRFDRATGTFESFRHQQDDSTSIGSDFISALAIDPTGALWIATLAGGLNRFDRESRTFQTVRLESTRPGHEGPYWILDVRAEPDGNLLVATDEDGLLRYDPVSEETSRVWPAALTENQFPAVIEFDTDPNGGIWMGTTEGLVYVDPITETTRHVAGTETAAVLSVLVGRDGAVWIGVENEGLFVTDLSGRPVSRVDGTAELNDDTIYGLIEDASGLIWVGTESSAVKVLTPVVDRFSALGRSMEDLDTWSIVESRSGELWVGTSRGGVDVLSVDGTVIRTYQAAELGAPSSGMIPRGLVMAMLEDARGRIWVGMDGGGAAAWDPETDRFDWFGPETTPGFRARGITALAEDADGMLWFGTAGWGLIRHDPAAGVFEEISLTADTLDDANVVYSIHVADERHLWMGTEGGAVRFDPVSRESIVIRSDPGRLDGLSSSTVFHVFESADGDVWAATQMGLHRLLNEPNATSPRFQRFTEASGLPNDVVYAIQPDDDGHLWLSTNRGLAALDPVSGDVRAFGPADGLPGFEFNSGAFTAGPLGAIYFGGIEGVTRLSADREDFRAFDAPVIVTSVDVFNEAVASDLSDGVALQLRHDQNYLTFSFASLDYLRPTSNRFAFRLEPDESGWTQAGYRRYQSYNNLAPGRYTFRVRGTNGDGVWSPRTTAISVYIVPPFWQRTWFRLLGALLLMGGLVVSVRAWHRRGLRKRDAQIEIQRRINDRLEAERLHMAHELHDGPIQHLQLSGFQLTSLDRQLAGDGADEVAEVRKAVGDAMTELRSICGELRPPALVHFGLSSAIRSHAERLLETHADLSLELELPTPGHMLSPRLRLGLFRMYQEAMSNVIRHALPCTARVTLVIRSDWTEVVVRDDGPGFEMPADWMYLAADGHFGLVGAKERAVAVGGTMSVVSEPGSGTTVRFRAPTVFDQKDPS